MKTLIVTASSKSKRLTPPKKFTYSKQRFTDSINSKFQKDLLSARKSLIETMNIEPGPDVFPKTISEDDPEFLPAYLRYSGRTYSKIDLDSWNTLSTKSNEWDCVILSALYGIIRYDEPIRNYSIKQTDKFPTKSTIAKFWNEQGASNWLFDYIKHNEFENVKFVLSTEYAGIVRRDDLIQRLKDELDIIGEDRQFKANGRASMLLRGQYINDLLTN